MWIFFLYTAGIHNVIRDFFLCNYYSVTLADLRVIQNSRSINNNYNIIVVAACKEFVCITIYMIKIVYLLHTVRSCEAKNVK